MEQPSWPENLWTDVKNGIWWPGLSEEQKQERLSDVLYIANLDTVLAESMDEKHQKVLRMRYEKGMTYKEIGDEQGVGRERIRQMIQKGLRTLREPRNYHKLCAVPKIEVIKLSRELLLMTKQYEDLKKEMSIMLGELEKRKAENRTQLPRDAKLDMLGLSVRSYNALIKNGISTVGDLVDCPMSRLEKFHSLGKTSLEDIVTCLAKFDYELK